MKFKMIAQTDKSRQRRILLAFALASLGSAGLTPASAATCSQETLASILFSQQVPVALFANPNGSPLTPAEIDEIQTTVLNIRSTVGEVSELVALKNPTIPRSLDITVGANVEMKGYSFSPKTYGAQTARAGNVIFTFATESRAEVCKVFWMRVSMPVISTNPNITKDDGAA